MLRAYYGGKKKQLYLEIRKWKEKDIIDRHTR